MSSYVFFFGELTIISSRSQLQKNKMLDLIVDEEGMVTSTSVGERMSGDGAPSH